MSPERARRTATARLSRAFVAAALCATLGGCASPFDEHRANVRELYGAGLFSEALAALDEPDARKRYGEKNAVLWWLDTGSAALFAGDHDRAVRSFSNAEVVMDRRREETLTESLGVLLINDRQRPYIGEPYEEMYLNVFKMLAHLQTGNIVGGATVEARRMATKANVLRDRYLEYESRARSAAGSAAPGDARPPGDVAAVNRAGEFIESPLGLFLTAATFMHSGETENKRVAARRLREVVRVQRGVVGPVDASAFEALEETTAADVNTLVVAFSGRGPHKEPFRFGPLLIDGAPIYFELPVLRWRESGAASARVVVDGDFTAPLSLVEDLSRVANENHRRQLPFIYLRTLVRAAAKSYGLREGVKAVERSTDNDWARIGAALGGLFLAAATERADLRCWETLPGRAFVALLDLNPGERTIHVEWLDAHGKTLRRSAPQTVYIPDDDGLTTLVSNWPR